MRTNINNNIIPKNYFIRRKKPLYIDSTNKVFIKKYCNECTNLEIVYKSQTNTYSNQNLKNINLIENEDIEVNGIIFNSEYKYKNKLIPKHYYNSGLWKPINNNYICDIINNIVVEYPIKILEPNIIVLDNNNYSLSFIIQDISIFNYQETFTVNFIPYDQSLKRTFTIPDKLLYDPDILNYSIEFNSSIFLHPKYQFYDNKYYIGLQSSITNKIYYSDPAKQIFITENLAFNSITFNSNVKQLNYSVTPNSDLLLYYSVTGLVPNSTYHLKISELHDTVPTYYSPPIKYDTNSLVKLVQLIHIPKEINKHNYNVELVTGYGDIMDLTSEIKINFHSNYKVHILNYELYSDISNESTITLNLCFDKKFINNVVNISLDNYFITNAIITNTNYLNYSLPIILNQTFDVGRYHIRAQIINFDNSYAISDEHISVSSNNISSLILPNFGYYNIPFSYSNKFNPITLPGNYICPYGVSSIDVSIIYNHVKITGQIILKAKSILVLTGSSLVINGRELINLITNTIVVNRINNYENSVCNLMNSINIKYVCESGYIIKLYNWDSSIANVDLYTANNGDGINLSLDDNYNVNYSTVYGYHIKINKLFFPFTGELHYYLNNFEYLNKITITDYPLQVSLNLLSSGNIIYLNQVVSGSIIINNFDNINLINQINILKLYFVDDLDGNNPEYLTTITNTLYFSFVYYTKISSSCTKYILITGNNNTFNIRKIINIPIIVEPEQPESIVNLKTTNANLKTTNVNLKTTPIESINLSIATAKPIVGVYTTFDTPPNKTTPSNFLQTYALYTYNNVPTLMGSSYSNFNGYLLLQCDSLSNCISQTNVTLDSFVSFIIAQLANKKINLIDVPSIFQDEYTTPNFVTSTHTFEYYNNTIFNNEPINIQSSLCSNVIKNNELITDITTIQKNFLQSYNDQIRNYTGQNTLNQQVEQVTTNTDNPPRFAWIENLGHYISQYFQLSINNVEIEKITSDWMNIWNEINIKPGHVSGYNKMIGNVSALTRFSPAVLPNYKLRIPIPFYFNRYNNAGLSIPLISLLHSDVKLTLQMEQLQNLIISDPLTKFITSGRPKVNLELKYIYLDTEERKRFATSKHEYLIEQENYRNYSHYGTSFNTKLNFMQPVKDLYWYAQPKQNTSNINSKQYYNYTDSKYYIDPANYDRYDEVNPITILSKQVYAPLYTENPNVNYIPYYVNNKITKSNIPFPTKSPINNTILRLNGQKRFDEDSDLTQLIHFHKYNNIPQSGVHAYPFCLYPNEYQPSGSCNFSVLGDAYFELDTDDGAYNVGIIARNYNLLRIMSGQAGLAFEL